MEKYAYVLMLVFAGVLCLAAASLFFSRDPRGNLFFPGGSGGKSMPKDAAVRLARQVAKGVALVALVIAVGSVVGFLRPDYGWWIILSGVIAAVLYAVRLSRLDSPPADQEDTGDTEG